MLGLAVLLMWGGPKLQRWLNPSETASSTAAPKPPVVSQSSEVDVKRIAAGVARALVASASSDELDPTCSEVRSCGNGVIDPGEECDGANLDGMSCTRLGFTGDCGDNPFCLQSRLGCSKSCRFDLRACTVQRADEPARFVDNGDGTVTDRLTNLMWEKKCHGPGCSFDHNVRTKIDWRGAASWWLEKLNNENHHGYAGYADWRLPTIGEIQTILAEPWPCRSNPCIDESVFGDGLTGRGAYWSGISLANNPSYGWSVGFNNGKAAPQVKRTSFYVRAVRTVGVDVEIPAPADDLASPSTGGGGDRVCSWVRLCGNGLLDAAERCDQLDLGGHTCASQGYSGDCGSETYCMERSLSCSSSCRLEVSGCSALSGTEPERFVEHGDGTISDRMTGLMWERKCTGDGCAATHDARRKLAWREAASDWIQELNAEQGSGYGGYGDWRLPTIAELRSLTLEPWPCTYGPCLEPSLLGLESTIGPSYWSATTFDADKSRAWSMSLSDGRSETQSKPVELYVLAVRRGEAYTPPLLASR
jgi:hypothetical protein